MKKVLFGIFAHPDDEAFGPSAYLYNAAKNNVDIHLILATDGEAGTNPDNDPHLRETRLKEWEESRKRIGATSGLALHYPDGGLCNDMYLEIAEKIISRITNICAQYNEPLSGSLLTFEPGGISGHLDHIAVSFITTYVFLKLQENPPPNCILQKLRYFCLPEIRNSKATTHWLYMPKGVPLSDIDEVFDFENVATTKQYIMEAHYSQRGDMKSILAQQNTLDQEYRFKEYFTYFKG